MKEVILLGFKMIFSVGLFSEIDWSLVGAIATIGAVIAAFVIYYLQKSKKRLSYEIISNTQLVGVESSIQDKIKILYDEKQVANVHLISIKFINNGNEPISVNDFDKPIIIRYDSAVNILTYEILEKTPEDLDATIKEKEGFLEIKPLLLNPNDNFIINILASDFEGGLEVSARIKGVNKVEIYKTYEKRSKFLVLINILAVILTIMNIFYGREIDSYFGINYDEILYSPILSAVMIVVLFVLSIKSYRK